MIKFHKKKLERTDLNIIKQYVNELVALKVVDKSMKKKIYNNATNIYINHKIALAVRKTQNEIDEILKDGE